MATTIASNTTSVSSTGYGSGSFTYMVDIVQNSYDETNRTVNITAKAYCKGVKSYYNNWGDSTATFTVTTSNAEEANANADMQEQHSVSTSSYTTLATLTKDFTYSADGTLVITATMSYGFGSSASYLPVGAVLEVQGNATSIGAAEVDPDQVEVDFAYTGTIQSFTTPLVGTYTLQCWGADGNNSYLSVAGGTGGYAKGSYLTTKDKTLYVVVGGKNSTYYDGGYNGGGAGTTQYNSGKGTITRKGGGGGGATNISLTETLLKDSTQSNVLIVAGGGGGAGSFTASAASYQGSGTASTGGAGGGTTGANAGGALGSGGYSYGGRGGLANSVGNVSGEMIDMDSDVNGGFGYGGAGEITSTSTSSYLYVGGGGGGAGWYGGSGGGSYANSTTLNKNKAGGGGGGSGHVDSSLTNTVLTQGVSANADGQGKSIITYLHKKINYNPNGGSTSPDVQEFAAPCTLTVAPSIARQSEIDTKYYTITVDTDGGDPIADLTTSKDDTTYYDFDGWTDGTNTYTAGSNQEFSDNKTLSATWSSELVFGTYSSVTIPKPNKASTKTETSSTCTLKINANGGTF